MQKRLFAVLSILLVLSMSLSMVGAQDDAPLPLEAVEGTPRGGTVQVSHRAQPLWVANFNILAPDPTPDTQGLIYEPLMVWNEVDGSKIPWLATSFEWSDDLRGLTVTLREGVQWSDGEDFNADDVVYTFNLLRERPELDRGALWQFIESVEKVDDYTVQFNLSTVNTLGDVQIGQVEPVPEHIYSQVEDPVTFTNENPVGTGPFANVCRFEEQVYELCANENYWIPGLPYVERLRYPGFAGNEQANLAVINGETDWAGHFLPDIEQTYVALDPENNHYYFWPGGDTVSIYMNTEKPPFDDVAFRQAVSQAIDYESVVGIGMYGYTVPANATGLGPRYANWVSQEALDTAAEMGLSTFDSARAATTLDEAGYVDADGDGWRDNLDGSPIAFNVQVVNGWTDWVTSVQIISQNLQEIGVNAQVVTPEFGDWLNNLQTGTYDMSIGWGSAQFSPWNYYRELLYSGMIGEDGRANGVSWARWNSEEVDALIDQFPTTADEAEQMDIIGQIQNALVENVVIVPLFPGPTWYEYNTARFTGFPTEENYYTQGSPWDRASNSRLLVALQIHPNEDMTGE